MSFSVKPEPTTPAAFATTPASSSSRPSAPARRGGFQPAKVEPVQAEFDAQGNPNYSEYRLVFTGDGGWTYNIIKFNSNPNKPDGFSPLDLPQPALLNRKDPRPRPPPPPPTLDEHGNVVEELKPVLDINGKPMLGPDGKIIFATGKKGPGVDTSLIAPDGGAVKNKKNLFKKKTKQIFKVSQDRMRLRREERHPWVLEGNPVAKVEEGASSTTPGETWVGRMEDTGDKSFVMFVFEDDKDEFQVLDVRRWYKFQQRPGYNTLNMDEAEEIYARTMKGKDPRRWIMHSPTRTTSALPSTSTNGASSSRIKTEENLPSYLRRSAAASGSGSGGGGGGGAGRQQQERMDWEDDGGEEGGGRRRNDVGENADADADFEDEFSDDDGQIQFDQADEAENKELEERIKREFRQDGTAPDSNSADGSDDEDLFGDEALKGEGKAIKKVLKKNTRGDAYASDDEGHNPYASSDESDSDTPPSPPPALTQPSTLTASGLHVPPPPPSRNNPNPNSSSSSARHSSPGAALLAHRSISPKRNHRPRSRSGSPSAGSPPPSSSSNKRKSTPEASSSSAGGDGKKVRLQGPGGGSGGGNVKPPSEREIVNYIRNHTPDIQQLIKHFKKSLKSTNPDVTASNKAALIDVTKRVATFAGGVITLKAEYAGEEIEPR